MKNDKEPLPGPDKGIVLLNFTLDRPIQVICKQRATPWSGPHFPEGKNGWCNDVDCLECNRGLHAHR